MADGLFRREAMAQLLEEHLAHRADHHARLWMLLNVEMWYRLYRSGWSQSAIGTLMDEAVGLRLPG